MILLKNLDAYLVKNGTVYFIQRPMGTDGELASAPLNKDGASFEGEEVEIEYPRPLFPKMELLLYQAALEVNIGLDGPSKR